MDVLCGYTTGHRYTGACLTQTWTLAMDDGHMAEAEATEASQAVGELEDTAMLKNSKRVGDLCMKLAKLTSARCSGKIGVATEYDESREPPWKHVDNMIIFKAKVGLEKWRHLSNWAHRDFPVKVKIPAEEGSAETGFTGVDGRFASVESLYQALKFNQVELFTKGAIFNDGDNTVDLLDKVKPGFKKKFDRRKEANGPTVGFIALQVSQLWGETFDALKQAAELERFERARPAAFTQIDSGLCLLACQLLMLSVSSLAQRLLLETGDQMLEEFTDFREGDFWCRYRPESGPPRGENANGQNLMHLRALLRMSGPTYAGVCGEQLLISMWPVLQGKRVLSTHALEFYKDKAMTYSELLERVVPQRAPRGKARRRPSLPEAPISVSSGVMLRISFEDGEEEADLKAAARAAVEGNTMLLKEMLEKGKVTVHSTKYNDHDTKYVLVAAKAGHAEMVKMLLQEHGGCPNSPDGRNCSAAYHACEHGHSEVLQVLAAHRRHEALGTQWTIVGEARPSKGNEIVNAKLKDALHERAAAAAEERQPSDIVVQITSDELDEFEVDDLKVYSYIHVDTVYWQQAVLRVDFSLARTDKGRMKGFTPMHIACQRGDLHCLEILIAAGVDANCLSWNGTTPAHAACKNNHVECLEVCSHASTRSLRTA